MGKPREVLMLPPLDEQVPTDTASSKKPPKPILSKRLDWKQRGARLVTASVATLGSLFFGLLSSTVRRLWQEAWSGRQITHIRKSSLTFDETPPKVAEAVRPIFTQEDQTLKPNRLDRMLERLEWAQETLVFKSPAVGSSFHLWEADQLKIQQLIATSIEEFDGDSEQILKELKKDVWALLNESTKVDRITKSPHTEKFKETFKQIIDEGIQAIVAGDQPAVVIAHLKSTVKDLPHTEDNIVIKTILEHCLDEQQKEGINYLPKLIDKYRSRSERTTSTAIAAEFVNRLFAITRQDLCPLAYPRTAMYYADALFKKWKE